MGDSIEISIMRDTTSMGDDAVHGMDPQICTVEATDDVVSLAQQVLENCPAPCLSHRGGRLPTRTATENGG